MLTWFEFLMLPIGGDLLVQALGLPLPDSVVGFLALLAWLCRRGGRPVAAAFRPAMAYLRWGGKPMSGFAEMQALVASLAAKPLTWAALTLLAFAAGEAAHRRSGANPLLTAAALPFLCQVAPTLGWLS